MSNHYTDPVWCADQIKHLRAEVEILTEGLARLTRIEPELVGLDQYRRVVKSIARHALEDRGGNVEPRWRGVAHVADRLAKGLDAGADNMGYARCELTEPEDGQCWCLEHGQKPCPRFMTE